MILPLRLVMDWTQTIPLAILIYVPFANEVLRVRRRTAYFLSTAYFLVASIFDTMFYFAISVDGYRNFKVGSLSMSVMLAVFLCGWAFVVQVPPVRKVIVAGMIIHYAAALNMLVSISASWLLGPEVYPSQVRSVNGSPAVNVFLALYSLITWPLVWLFFRKILCQTLPVMDYKDNRRALLYMCIVFGTFSGITAEMSYSNQPNATIVAVCTVITNVMVYLSFFRELNLTRERLEIAQQVADYQMQYQMIVSRMEGTRQLRHDLRHHLNMLGTLNAQGRTEDIAEYLKEYNRVYEQLERQNFSGDPAVDSVLGYYLARTSEEHIRMDCDVRLRRDHGIAHIDMTVLLGNCLENALEAAARLPEEERRITIELQSVERMVLLRVVNSCGAGEDTEGFAGWQDFPSGRKKGRTGVGLRSVSEIAVKYGGSAQFQRRGGEFTTRVTLCILPESAEEGESRR